MPFLQGSDLLVCADCVPVAVPDFHRRYLANRTLAIACPKLDDMEDIVERLIAIFTRARPRSVTVLRMEVPCCGGLVAATQEALHRSTLETPLRVEVIQIEDGRPLRP